MIINAQDIGRTRLCAAAGCTDDAELAATLCRRCARLPSVRLQDATATQHDELTTLWCHGPCKDRKPDAEFAYQHANKRRRGRHGECKACAATRRRLYRLDPVIHARELALERARRNPTQETT